MGQLSTERLTRVQRAGRATRDVQAEASQKDVVTAARAAVRAYLHEARGWFEAMADPRDHRWDTESVRAIAGQLNYRTQALAATLTTRFVGALIRARRTAFLTGGQAAAATASACNRGYGPVCVAKRGGMLGRLAGYHVPPVTRQACEADWDEDEHPKHSAGDEKGGEFAPKGEDKALTRVTVPGSDVSGEYYHGSSKGAVMFDTKAPKFNFFGREGVYLAVDPENAKQYARGFETHGDAPTLLTVRATPERAFDAKTPLGNAFDFVRQELIRQADVRQLSTVGRRVLDADIAQHNGHSTLEQLVAGSFTISALLPSALKQLGFDAIKQGQHLIVLDPDRVKVTHVERLHEADWDEDEHPRQPAGDERGGEFAPKGEEGKGDTTPAQPEWRVGMLAEWNPLAQRRAAAFAPEGVVTDTPAIWTEPFRNAMGQESVLLTPEEITRMVADVKEPLDLNPEKWDVGLEVRDLLGTDRREYPLAKLFVDEWARREGILPDPPATNVVGPKLPDAVYAADTPDTVRDAESLMIYRTDREFALWQGPDGETRTYRGAATTVPLDLKGLQPAYRGVFTHNHPNGYSLSRGDVLVAGKVGLKEIRAVGVLEPGVGVVYRLSTSHPDTWPDKERIELEYETATYTVRNRQNKKLNAGTITMEQANREHQHLVWEEATPKLGLEYKRVTFPLAPVELRFNDNDILRFRRTASREAGEWNEEEHPRQPAAGEAGSQFSPKGTATGGLVWAKNPPTPEAFIAARNKSGRSHFLSGLKPAELGNHRLALNEEDTIGFALDKHGDLQNLFSTGGSLGGGAEAVFRALDMGAKTLDCFAGFLPGYYATFGFRETGRMVFDSVQAPPNWDSKKLDSPDIVFMTWEGYPHARNEIRRRLTDRPFGKYRKSTRYYTDWDAAKVHAQRAANPRVGR